MTQILPGPTTCTTDHLRAALNTQLLPLEFWLDGQPLVGPGYHVTEVKAVAIEAMDCGGQASTWHETVVQLMDGSAGEAAQGFMTARKFLAIFDRVTARIPVRAAAEVRFEYGTAARPALQYHVAGLDAQADRFVVHLATPGVQCKAGAACGLPVSDERVPAERAEGCTPASGCCTPGAPDLIRLG